MLQRIKIENFIRVPYLDLETKTPALLVCGPNEAGKSSIAEAVRFALFGESPRVEFKKNFDQLVTNGAKRASVEITFNNFTVRRNVKDAKATGDTDQLPTDRVVMDICTGALRFVDLPPAGRRGLVMRLLNVEVTPEKITAELKERGIPAKTIQRYEPIYKHGLAAAFDKASRIQSEGRGEWKGVTGENYGSEKAETWKPQAPVLALAEVQETISGLDIEIVGMQSEQGAEVDPIEQRITELTRELETPSGIPCPACGVELRFQGGKLHEHQSLTPERRRELETARTLQIARRGEVKAKYDAKLRQKLTDRAALEEQVRQHATNVSKEKRAKEIHAEIKDAELLRDLFGDGPDGIMGRLVGQALKGFNAGIADIADVIGWHAVTLGGDMAVHRIDHVPYALLSESAQWRADLLLHTLIASLAGCEWLIFDRVDVLDPASRIQFVQWLNGFIEAARDHWPLSVLAFATLKQPPDLSSLPFIQVEWMEAGELMRREAV